MSHDKIIDDSGLHSISRHPWFVRSTLIPLDRISVALWLSRLSYDASKSRQFFRNGISPQLEYCSPLPSERSIIPPFPAESSAVLFETPAHRRRLLVMHASPRPSPTNTHLPRLIASLLNWYSRGASFNTSAATISTLGALVVNPLSLCSACSLVTNSPFCCCGGLTGPRVASAPAAVDCARMADRRRMGCRKMVVDRANIVYSFWSSCSTTSWA